MHIWSPGAIGARCDSTSNALPVRASENQAAMHGHSLQIAKSTAASRPAIYVTRKSRPNGIPA